MFKVYAQEDNEKLFANSFETELQAILYVAFFRSELSKNYPNRNIEVTIEKAWLDI